jgi:hypothetical protein
MIRGSSKVYIVQNLPRLDCHPVLFVMGLWQDWPRDRSGPAAEVVLSAKVVLPAKVADTMSAQRLKLRDGTDRYGKS